MQKSAFLLSLALLLPACLPGFGPKTETTYDEVAVACVSGEPNSPLSVELDFGVCMSSSCDTLVEWSCETELTGNTVTVTASATVESKQGACTDDCGSLVVTCDELVLAAGTYDFVFGDLQTTVVLPADPETPEVCVGGFE